ncbi:hypothetical protein B0H67DRAFT_235989 [Lasiosphaeris hirsuta]|uniref:Uncharacterized protein n=1 Tax=Lasiosphaeris hirsuta TaxID=260670 RepID=A0AA40AG28_9PEZI|nr:hypothetical protein B0H67DRAFT_235989 [Lasiosphaeris hirsuta]
MGARLGLRSYAYGRYHGTGKHVPGCTGQEAVGSGSANQKAPRRPTGPHENTKRGVARPSAVRRWSSRPAAMTRSRPQCPCPAMYGCGRAPKLWTCLGKKRADLRREWTSGYRGAVSRRLWTTNPCGGRWERGTAQRHHVACDSG